MCCLAAKLIRSFSFLGNNIFYTKNHKTSNSKHILSILNIFINISDFLPDNPHEQGKDEKQHEQSASVVTSMFLFSLNILIQIDIN